jgi:hypothetical protein
MTTRDTTIIAEVAVVVLAWTDVKRIVVDCLTY